MSWRNYTCVNYDFHPQRGILPPEDSAIRLLRRDSISGIIVEIDDRLVMPGDQEAEWDVARALMYRCVCAAADNKKSLLLNLRVGAVSHHRGARLVDDFKSDIDMLMLRPYRYGRHPHDPAKIAKDRIAFMEQALLIQEQFSIRPAQALMDPDLVTLAYYAAYHGECPVREFLKRHDMPNFSRIGYFMCQPPGHPVRNDKENYFVPDLTLDNLIQPRFYSDPPVFPYQFLIDYLSSMEMYSGAFGVRGVVQDRSLLALHRGGYSGAFFFASDPGVAEDDFVRIIETDTESIWEAEAKEQ